MLGSLRRIATKSVYQVPLSHNLVGVSRMGGVAASPLGRGVSARGMSVDAEDIERVHNRKGAIGVSTRDCVAGREIVKELGLVTAGAVRSKNIFQDVLAALAGMVGGEVPTYTDLVADTSAEASRRLMETAQELGATSVVRVHFQTATTMNRYVFILFLL